MESVYRQARLTLLRSAQNQDGGWGYCARHQSWLEPTCYALLALYQDPESIEAWNRGWKLMRSWQNMDGGWRPAAGVASSHWATALSVTVHCVHGVFDDSPRRGVGWILGMKGNEGGWLERAINTVHKLPNEYDRRFKGWPWIADTASWIEPTAHSLLALKKAAQTLPQEELRRRVNEGERMILDRRSADGGWNYGNRRVLHTNLPSYPETTGVALLGLQGSTLLEVPQALRVAYQYWMETRSGLAKAWLAISLRNYGKDLPAPDNSAAPGADLMLAALEAISCPNGGHQWLKPA
ncbi:MAG TPA: hypothetical protein VM120_14740 [Bryobacteraceae bacterium]|nr:hypothetical protein [Bryobacteraceae bacterium]